MERIYIDRDELRKIEKQMILLRHVERYGLIRQFLYGKVVDCACGVGYGTFLCSENPDVAEIIGVDIDYEAIKWANEHFANKKTKFICDGIESFQMDNVDVLVSLETIEHLERPEEIREMAKKCGAREVIISFPTKKTTHYNRYHYYDFRQQDIEDIFNEYALVKTFNQVNEFCICHFIARTVQHKNAKIFRSR